jgi:aminopeptidase YwaD
MTQADTVTADIQTVTHDTTYSWNAIGIKTALNEPDTAPVFIITSHIDTVIGAPGANDNASGTAVMLEAARALATLDTPDVELRFISFGAEELGLIGSKWYVDRMPLDERARVKGVFNMDMTASSDEEFATYWTMSTVRGLPNLVTRSFIATAGRLGYGGHLELALFLSSDHVPFDNGGMPAAMGMWMGKDHAGMITPNNYTVERYYHTPQDTAEENLSEERLKMCVEIVTATVYDMALNYQDAPHLMGGFDIPSEFPDINELNGSYREAA